MSTVHTTNCISHLTILLPMYVEQHRNSLH